jgi:hypothetical protein
MAMDKTPPRNRLIAFYTALAVATLLALKPAFDSYFDRMKTTAVQDRLVTYDDLQVVQEAEAEWSRELCLENELAQLESADQRRCTGRSIEETMQQLARRGRTAMPAIRPEASEEPNLDALRGWTERPQEVPEAAQPGAAEDAAEPQVGAEALEGGEDVEGVAPAPDAPDAPDAAEGAETAAAPEAGAAEAAPSPSEAADPTDSGDE